MLIQRGILDTDNRLRAGERLRIALAKRFGHLKASTTNSTQRGILDVFTNSRLRAGESQIRIALAEGIGPPNASKTDWSSKGNLVSTTSRFASICAGLSWYTLKTKKKFEDVQV